MKETVKKLMVPRTRRFVHFLCFCVFLALVAAGCSLPQAPGDLSWDTHLVLPLGVRTYGLSDMVLSDAALADSGSGVGKFDSSNTDDPTLYGKLFFATYTKVKVPIGDSLIIHSFSKSVIKPQNTNLYNDYAQLPNLGHSLSSGQVAEGSLHLSLRNLDDNNAGQVTITIGAFKSSSGDTLRIVMNNVGAVSRDTTINLRGYSVTLDPAENPQRIPLRIATSMNEQVSASMSMTQMTFIFYSGTLNHLVVPAISGSTGVESLPNGWNAVHPTTVDALVHMTGEPAFYHATTDMDLTVLSLLHHGPLDSVRINNNAMPLAADTTIVVHNLAHMIDTYPDEVQTRANLVLNGEVRNLSGSDTVAMNVEMRSPLSFRLDSLHATGDDQIDTVKSEGMKDIESNGSKAIIRIWNHLPVGGRVYLVADSIRNNVLSTSHANVDTVLDFSIPMPSLDANGDAISQVMIVDTVLLDSNTVNLMKRGEFYTRTDVGLNSSNGSVRIANANDYVKVQIIADIQRHVSTKGND